MCRGSKRTNIMSFIINLHTLSSTALGETSTDVHLQSNFLFMSFWSFSFPLSLFIKSVSLNVIVSGLTHQTEPEASGKGGLQVDFYIFLNLVKADPSTCAYSNGCQRTTDWQLSLCETNTPAWPSFNRNALVEVCLCVRYLCVCVCVSASLGRSNVLPSFIPPFFVFNSSLPRHLILWTFRHVRADGAFLPPRLESFELSCMKQGQT